MAQRKTEKVNNAKIVMRLTHSYVLVNFSFDAEEYKTHSRVLAWKLPKSIDPNNINPEMEFLSTFLSRMVRLYQLEGETVSWIIPHARSRMKTVSVPMNLTVKADKKEFSTLTKATPYEFWKEHDPDLADMRLVEIRSSFLTANAEENSSNLLYVAADKLILRNYQNLSLAANLYPVAFIPIDQSLIRVVESRLSRVHRERPFAIFHLSKGNNRIIYVNAERLEIAQVNINELDEGLLEDIPKMTDQNKEFWLEVVKRISMALKTAANYLIEESKVTKFENIYFICDYDNESEIFNLLRETYRDINILSLIMQFQYVSIQKPIDKKGFLKDMAPLNPDLYEGSKFIPSMGVYNMRYFSDVAIPNLVINANIMNLHEKGQFIASNFANEAKVKFGFNLVWLFYATLMVLTAVIYFMNMNSLANVTKYQEAEKKLTRLQQAIKSSEAQVEQKKGEYNVIVGLSNGITNQALLVKLIRDLPKEIELERVVVRENTFQIFGNSLNIKSVNGFYSAFMQDKNFSKVKINSFRHKDKPLNFFELVGVIEKAI